MITIAICDDEEQERAQAQQLLEHYLDEHPALDGSLSLFESGSAILAELEAGQQFDIYILDIIMPGLSGIALGTALREQGAYGQIIYLTSSRDFAVESYDTDALHYLVKPVTASQLSRAMDKAVRILSQKYQKAILVNTQNGVCRVLFDQILCVDQSDRMMHFYLSEGSAITSCVLRESFATAVQPLLADPRFLLCGSSFVVNLHRIIQIDKENTTFSNGLSIPLPRSLQKSVKRKWMEYWLRIKNSAVTRSQ